MNSLIDLFLHLDTHLNHLADVLGPWLYLVLFAIVFCETGLVVTPILPGDSLLFAVGALAAAPNSPIHLPLVLALLCLAANSGDLLNYSVGFHIGPAIFSRPTSRLLNRKYLLEAQRFYEQHGRKTIIMARFVPIIRTFAPFVAGIGKMPFSRFIGFSISGGILWIVLLTVAGFFFNQIAFVRDHFQLVVVAIVIVSLLPAIYHAMQARAVSDESMTEQKEKPVPEF